MQASSFRYDWKCSLAKVLPAERDRHGGERGMAQGGEKAPKQSSLSFAAHSYSPNSALGLFFAIIACLVYSSNSFPYLINMNAGMVWAGRELKAHPVSPLPQQGHLPPFPSCSPQGFSFEGTSVPNPRETTGACSNSCCILHLQSPLSKDYRLSKT